MWPCGIQIRQVAYTDTLCLSFLNFTGLNFTPWCGEGCDLDNFTNIITLRGMNPALHLGAGNDNHTAHQGTIQSNLEKYCCKILFSMTSTIHLLRLTTPAQECDSMDLHSINM